MNNYKYKPHVSYFDGGEGGGAYEHKSRESCHSCIGHIVKSGFCHLL